MEMTMVKPEWAMKILYVEQPLSSVKLKVQLHVYNHNDTKLLAVY